MNWTIIKDLGEFIRSYTNNEVFGYIRLVIDLAIIIAALIMIYRTFIRYTNSRVIIILTLGLLALLLVIILLDFRIKFCPFINICI